MLNEMVMMVIGPEGVGKSTLLATMYQEFINTPNDSLLGVVATKETKRALEESYQKLSEIVTQPVFTPVSRRLLPSTANMIPYQFEVTFKGKKELAVKCYDCAGELVLAEVEEDQGFKVFKTKLAQAVVIVNVIDGAALMEGNQASSDKINQSRRIYELLHPVLTNDKNHLILFVITKCEAWLKGNKSARQKLQEVFEKRYRRLLTLIKDCPNVVGVLMPVKTLGCVEFSHIEGRGETGKLIFVKKANLAFAPTNTAQPLRYALAFALSQHDRRRSLWLKLLQRFSPDEVISSFALSRLPQQQRKKSGLWKKLLRRLAREEIVFKTALTKFTSEQHSNFKVYGNKLLLEEVVMKEIN
jgi:energy-coupling factor transporter ATP-binding protein EcfA2